jgi:acyl-CoA oxidase
MFKEADLVQQVAKSYGERVCHENMYESLKNCAERVGKPANSALKLSLLANIIQDLAFYLLTNAIDKQGAIDAQNAFYQAVREVHQHSERIINEGFDIPEHLLFAPIARDWVEYNKHDNKGNWISSKY